jgi:hypothetical protein
LVTRTGSSKANVVSNAKRTSNIVSPVVFHAILQHAIPIKGRNSSRIEHELRWDFELVGSLERLLLSRARTSAPPSILQTGLSTKTRI